jgi:hypothetical protein
MQAGRPNLRTVRRPVLRPFSQPATLATDSGKMQIASEVKFTRAPHRRSRSMPFLTTTSQKNANHDKE